MKHILLSMAVAAAWLLLVPVSSKAQTNSIPRPTPEEIAYSNPWQVSLLANGAFGPDNKLLGEGSMGISYMAAPDVRIGLEEVGFASSPLLSGSRYGISFAPSVEGFRTLSEYFTAYGALDFPLQVRFGAGLDTRLGFQPAARVGVDYYFVPGFSMGLFEKLGYVASDAYVVSTRVLPQGAVIISTGLALHFHF